MSKIRGTLGSVFYISFHLKKINYYGGGGGGGGLSINSRVKHSNYMNNALINKNVANKNK